MPSDSFHAPSGTPAFGITPSGSPSATASADTSGSVKVPVVVGVVIAVILGVGGIIFAVTWFMVCALWFSPIFCDNQFTMFQRRSRRNDDDDVFRRQSMVLPEEPSMNPRGAAPGSSMTEHRYNSPVSYGSQPQFGDHSFYGGGYNQNSFAPGEVVAMPPQAWSPAMPDSAQPFYNPMGESPMGSPVSPSPYDSFYNAQGQLVRQPSAGSGAILNRQPSAGAASALNRQPSSSAASMFSRQASPGPGVAFNRQPSPGPGVALNRQPSLGPGVPLNLNRQPSPGPGAALNRQQSNGAGIMLNRQPPMSPGVAPNRQPSPGPNAAFLTRQTPGANMQLELPNEAHYVDLNRSSVSPFQAAQYAEISNTLQTAPPAPLPTPVVAAAAEQILTNPAHVVPTMSEPRPLRVMNGMQSRSEFGDEERVSATSPFADPRSLNEDVFEGDEDVLPPTFAKSRIDSTPPRLPELTVQQRAFSPVTMEFPHVDRPAPSPLATSVTIPSPPAQAHFGKSPTPVPSLRPTREELHAKRPDTVYTLYEDEDAYAGI